MSDTVKYVQSQTFFLSGSGAVAAATSVTLTSMYQIDGTTLLTMTDFGGLGFGTLEPNNSTQEEQISFTGITQNANGTATLTGVSTVLNVSPYTKTSGLAKAHPGGAKFIISNTAGFYDELSGKDNDETVTGLWQFPNNANTPILGTTYVAPTTQTQIASKGYVDSIAIAGAPNATLSVQGLVQLPTQSQVDNRTLNVGLASGAVTADKLRTVLTTDYVVDTGTKNAYAIAPTPAVTKYVAGMVFTFKAINANSGASTLNVNSLGVKNLTAGKTTSLRGEYIRTNYIISAVYTGTEMEILSVSGQVPVSQDGAEIYGVSSTGNTAWTVALVPTVSKYTAGMVVNFKPGTVGGHPTLNINGLGAKNVIKYKNGASSAIELGDIIANQIVTVVYDNTSWQVVNNLSSNPKYTNGTTFRDLSTASGTQTIAHGLGKSPLNVRISGALATTAFISTATTVYNGSTQSSASVLYNEATDGASALTFIAHAVDTSNIQTGVLTFDATNIYIAWTKTGSPTGNYNFFWEAQA